MTTAQFAALAGPTARAMHLVQQQRDPQRDVSGRITCTKCGSSLRFTVMSNGLSRGQCTAAGCVRWCQ
jgi:hypothetical protein